MYVFLIATRLLRRLEGLPINQYKFELQFSVLVAQSQEYVIGESRIYSQ